jgi:hypothetical protein
MSEILNREAFESLVQEREKISFKDEQWLFKQSMTLNKLLYDELTVEEPSGVVVVTVEGSFNQVLTLQTYIKTAGYILFVEPVHVSGKGRDALLVCEIKITYTPGALISKDDYSKDEWLSTDIRL